MHNANAQFGFAANRVYVAPKGLGFHFECCDYKYFTPDGVMKPSTELSSTGIRFARFVRGFLSTERT